MAASRNKPFTDGILRAVSACFSRYVRQRQSLVVGFSGGIDSPVLLHAASCLASDADIKLSALHVHHGLSRNADTWANSCATVCDGLGIPLAVRRVAVPKGCGEGFEAAARRMRHQALSDQSADWILLAHHADDQAETILHNLLRGAGVRGAAAIPEVRGRVLRPLLGLPRTTLLEYANSRHLAWVEDESNADNSFTRNFLRHEILPALSLRFPRACEQLAAAAGRFGEANSLLDELALLDLRGSPPEFPLSLDLLQQLSAARVRNLLRAMLTWHHVQSPAERRLNEFVRQLHTVGNDRHPRIDLGRYSLWCQTGKLYFKIKK